MSTISWLDRPEDFEFVKALERFPCIWDRTHPEHKKPEAKREAMKEISYYSGVDDPTAKYKAIRDKYVRRSHFDKSRNSLPWALETKLGFLKTKILKRSQPNNNAEDSEKPDPLEHSSILEIKMKTEVDEKGQISFLKLSDQPSSSQPESCGHTLGHWKPPSPQLSTISSSSKPIRIAPKRSMNPQLILPPEENSPVNGMTPPSMHTFIATPAQKLSGVQFRETSATADDINMAFGRVVGLSLKALPKQTASRLRSSIMTLLSAEEARFG